MDIEFEETGSGGRYFIPEAGTIDVAELTYHYKDDGVVVADHTYVPHRYRGQGIANRLVLRLIADARDRDWKVLPACSYVAAKFRRHSDWNDLLAK